jgi:general secretion pathway protein I
VDLCGNFAHRRSVLEMRNRGFTILEVLAALAIFAIAAIVLGTAYVNVLNGYQLAERSTQINVDVRFAREILFYQSDLEKVEEGGDFETVDGRQVSWIAEVEPTMIADLFDVTFEVNIQSDRAGEQDEFVERFRMLRPTWSEDDEREKLRQEMRDRITRMLEDREP